MSKRDVFVRSLSLEIDSNPPDDTPTLYRERFTKVALHRRRVPRRRLDPLGPRRVETLWL